MKKLFKPIWGKLIVFGFVLSALVAFGGFALAQDLGLDHVDQTGLQTAADSDIRVAIAQIVRYLLTFVGLIAVIFIIYGGYLWMTSAGDASRVEKAKKTLIGAVIGLIIILLAFAIVTFVINVFDSAVGTSCDPPCFDGERCCPDNVCCAGSDICCGGGCCNLPYCCAGVCSAVPCGAIPGDNILRLDSYSPIGNNVIRNARVRLRFSRTLDQATVNAASVRILSGGSALTGFLESSGRAITFIPDGDCGPNECGASGCFDPGDVRVEIENVRDNQGNALSRMNDPASPFDINCGGPGDPCVYSFTVGDLIDCQDPTVSLDIEQVCAMPGNELHAFSSDDSGIHSLTFFVDGELADEIINPSAGPVFNTRAAGLWGTWDGSGREGDRVDIRVLAQDINDHSSQRSARYTVRPGHCCNGVMDGDETGVDCGGSCAACAGAACGASLADDCSVVPGLNCRENDDRCSSRFCDCQMPDGATCQDLGYAAGVNNCCVCLAAPIIDWISPVGGFCRDEFDNPQDTACLSDADCGDGTCDSYTPNGAPGNLVTIGGRNFGDLPGQVSFGGTPAVLAACANAWSDRQVIVVVSSLAALNEYAVTLTENTSGNNYSDTYDGFLANSIVRPGLCEVSPDAGQMNTQINYLGGRLNGSQAFFGNLSAQVPALNSVFNTDTAGTAYVPNLRTGRTTTFVMNGNRASNFLQFRKLADQDLGSYIISFDPVSGNVGQYVTIRGAGFGPSRRSSRVIFDNGSNSAEADYDFPAICAGSLWSNNQILVKVPAGLSSFGPGNYTIRIELASGNDIDTGELDPSAFAFDPMAVLAPSLCRIEPRMAPNGADVRLYGEYFGITTPGLVRFHLDQDQPGGVWANESGADIIDTSVPVGAVSGPVRAVNSSGLAGNGLNLNIGFCSDAPDPDAACGGLCCPSDSYRAGRCASDDILLGGNGDGNVSIEDCFIQARSSVYEWTFDTAALAGLGQPCQNISTTNTCSDPALPECQPGLFCDDASGCTCQFEDLLDNSCGGLARRLNFCQTDFCPNTPGQCSPLEGDVVDLNIACSDAACAAVYPATTYNSFLNRCVETGQNCSLDRRLPDAIGRLRPVYCAPFGAEYRWHMDTSLSCPAGWRMLMGNVCVNEAETCQLCGDGFTCQDDGSGTGLCAIGASICPFGSDCIGDTCQRDNSQCECCCEEGQSERDCCAFEYPAGSGNYTQLNCEGTCGQDAGPNGEDWGLCTGCAHAGASQTERDAACNCAGSSGRYCDTSTNPDGVCRDCSQISDPSACSAHAQSCCVDADYHNVCRSGEGTTLGNLNSFGYTMNALGGNPAWAYCSYYECDSANDGACSTAAGQAVASSTDPASPLFSDINTCENRCGAGGLPPGSACYDDSGQSCTLDCAPGYNCIGESGCSGSACAPDDHTCACCCSPALDQCNVINPSLVCQADISPCSGADRGLCCGCSQDSDCALGSPVAVGCGSDRCCRPRPSPQSEYPRDESVHICRNTSIELEFDQLMNPGSFGSNVILVGDHLAEPCPAGTVYLAAAGRDMHYGFWIRTWYKAGGLIAKILPARLAGAFTPPQATRNYCAISGSAGSFNSAADTTVLTFAPSRLLDAGRMYYVIVKGESDIDDSANSGVLSFWGIGMNGSLAGNGADADKVFNGIHYQNSYVWSFRTMDEQAPNNGVCALESVSVIPNNYLFSTVTNDLREADDNFNDPSYDTAADADKEFRAIAYSSRQQRIVPVAGYSWTWNWSIANPNVLAFVPVPALPADRVLVRAQSDQVDARTQLIAGVSIIADENGYGGADPASANIFVFLCDNPWPPRANDGSWQPWIDDSGNCDPTLQGCPNTGFDIYYCRDQGRAGTYDDLPAIRSSDVLVRGRTPLACSVMPGNCSGSSLGTPCGPGNTGICTYVLKEAFFFRTPAPGGSTDLTITNTGLGGQVQASWPVLAGAAGYRVYWGESAANYRDYIEFRPLTGLVDAGSFHEGDVACGVFSGTAACSIDNLENDRRYFFNLTAFNTEGAESEYYGEENVIVADTIPPDVPEGLIATPRDREVELRWDPSDDTANYRVYYGSSPGVYGAYNDIGTDTAIIISGLQNGQTYYFAVSAADNNGNESERSADVSATPGL